MKMRHTHKQYGYIYSSALEWPSWGSLVDSVVKSQKKPKNQLNRSQIINEMPPPHI